LSLFLSSFLASRPREGRRSAGDLLSVTKGSGGNLFPLSYSVFIEGEEEPDANDPLC
jgi:hypothetical protein